MTLKPADLYAVMRKHVAGQDEALRYGGYPESS